MLIHYTSVSFRPWKYDLIGAVATVLIERFPCFRAICDAIKNNILYPLVVERRDGHSLCLSGPLGRWDGESLTSLYPRALEDINEAS